ncbi:NADAR family protein [Aestuariicella hydrocarbonica]|uniref:NADAR family protein n=1 Tax=Pseudomaricurvus hydrocarbonicus TaxID=1470433 RepID=A0A9E5JRQ8_9GAMM|nr:NADAR family protein [Aestuariicella hydrocarbonica]NHO65508.1 NADAR family protein [Aestuariicella hydrocarbonica]
MEGLFLPTDENAYYFSRSDDTELLGTYYPLSFTLEGVEWPTVEHYFQAMKFEDSQYREKIRAATSPKQARKLGRNRFKRPRPDWKSIRTTIMTRAVYTRCKTHTQAYQALMDTDAKKIVESSSYDYFWGCGRDRLGHNHYGVILTKVRDKLREEEKASQ